MHDRVILAHLRKLANEAAKAKAKALFGSALNYRWVDDVKAKQKELAKQFHPDRNPSPDAADIMKAINALADEYSRGLSRKPVGYSEPAQRAPSSGASLPDFVQREYKEADVIFRDATQSFAELSRKFRTLTIAQLESYQESLSGALYRLSDLYRQNPLKDIKKMHETISNRASVLASSLNQLNGVFASQR